MPAMPEPAPDANDTKVLFKDCAQVGDIYHCFCEKGHMELTFQNASIVGAISFGEAKKPVEPIESKWWRVGEFDLKRAPVRTDKNLIVTLDASSSWTVTDTCFITCLDLAPGARVLAPEGKELVVECNGEVVKPEGKLEGKVVLSVK